MKAEWKNQSHSRQKGVKREEAGLLWHLFGKEARRRFSAFLTTEDMEALNSGFRSYLKRKSVERRLIEKQLLLDIVPASRHLPLLLFYAMLSLFFVILFLHFQFVPGMGTGSRALIFIPFFSGVVAPLSLYLLPGLRRKILFQPNFNLPSAAFALFSFLGLIWTLYYIGVEGRFGGGGGGWTLLALFVGAVSAPLLEEVIFRELIPNLFGDSPSYFGHLISSILFAAGHIPSSQNMFLLYAVAGLFLSILRLETGGLFYPVLVHSSANGLFQLFF